MAEETELAPAVSLPRDFRIEEVSSLAIPKQPMLLSSTPSLGPLAAFVGTWTGSGFNTIFRPDSPQTPTVLPVPVTGSDNVLELNLTSETLSFSGSLGSVPNRGMVQGDVFLNGVPYLQTINDVTTSSPGVGIHLEPGLWVIVPITSDPAEGQTLGRMASIPHGTTIAAQGTSTTISGKPTHPRRRYHPVLHGQSGGQDHIPKPDRDEQDHAADSTGPDLVHQRRYHHAGHVDRSQHGPPQPHRRADDHLHHHDIHLHQPGCAAVRRWDRQHRLSAGQRRGQRPERPDDEDDGDILDRDRRTRHPRADLQTRPIAADDRSRAGECFPPTRAEISRKPADRTHGAASRSPSSRRRSNTRSKSS